MGPWTGQRKRHPSGSSGMALVPVPTMRGVASDSVTALRSLLATGTPQRFTTRDRTLDWPASPSWMIRCWPWNMVSSSWVSKSGRISRVRFISSTVETTSRGQDCSMVMVSPASSGVCSWSPRSASRSMTFSSAWESASALSGDGSSAAETWASAASLSGSSSKGLEAVGAAGSRVRSGLSSRNRSSVMEKRAVTDSMVSPGWVV